MTVRERPGNLRPPVVISPHPGRLCFALAVPDGTENEPKMISVCWLLDIYSVTAG